MKDLIKKYKILENHKVIIEYFKGIITLDSYISFKKELINDPYYDPKYNYIIYFKNVTFNTTYEDIDLYVKFSNTYLTHNSNRKIALITENPNQTVPSILFKTLEYQHKTSKKIEVFSTVNAALNWINIEIGLDEMDVILQNLKN